MGNIDESFRTYIGVLIKKTQKSREQYKQIRASKDIKLYLSKLLIDFCRRIFYNAYMTITFKKQKTIDSDIFMHLISMWLYDGITPDNYLESKTREEYRDLTEEEKVAKKKKKDNPKVKVDYYEVSLHYLCPAIDTLKELIEYYRIEKIEVEDEVTKKKKPIAYHRYELYQELKKPECPFLNDDVLHIEEKKKEEKPKRKKAIKEDKQ
mgnify:CR=1 FL=1